MNFDHEYWEPEKGRINCMACGEAIHTYSAKTNRWYRLSNARGIPSKRIVIDDASTIPYFTCRNCMNIEVDYDKNTSNPDKIITQIKKAFEKEIIRKGENKNDRDMVLKFQTAKALRKINEGTDLSKLKKDALNIVKELEDKGKIPKKIHRRE